MLHIDISLTRTFGHCYPKLKEVKPVVTSQLKDLINCSCKHAFMLNASAFATDQSGGLYHLSRQVDCPADIQETKIKLKNPNNMSMKLSVSLLKNVVNTTKQLQRSTLFWEEKQQNKH
eukprot:4047771-Ditylum_brightwellii.AAC.2